jgi:beta-glucanase (GH16 family)
MKNIIVLISFLAVFINYERGFSQTCDFDKWMFDEETNWCDDNPYILVFEDEFNGGNLNTDIWRTITGIARDEEFESQKAWHKPENIIVEDGLLKIISKKEYLPNMKVVTSWDPYEYKYVDFDYSTGEIWTKAKFGHGMYSARVKIPKGKGLWPAFWLFSSPWNEIDIFEFWNENNISGNYDPSKLSRIQHRNMWCDYDLNGGVYNCPTESKDKTDFSADFHIFTMIWSKYHVSWYVDGELSAYLYRFYKIDWTPVGCDIPEFDILFTRKSHPVNPMSIIFNVAIQNGYDNTGNNKAPDASTPFPTQMEVDWVRYHTKNPPPGNVVISSPSDLPLKSDEFNSVVGSNVTFNGNYPISSTGQLVAKAEGKLTLKKGFHAKNGSSFHASTGEIITNEPSNLKSASGLPDEVLSKIEASEKEIKEEIFTLQQTIRAYPNPSSDLVNIDFGTIDHTNYEMKVTNIYGQTFYSNNNISSSHIILSRNNFKSGVYFIELYNKETKDIQRIKIVFH